MTSEKSAENHTVVSLQVLSDCSFVYPELLEQFIYWPNSSLFTIPESQMSELIPDCLDFYDTQETWRLVMNALLSGTIMIGFLFNLLIFLLLCVDKERTSADIYIMSIAIADMCICAGGGISSQLMRFMDHFPVHLAGQLIGNAGMFGCISTIVAFTVDRYVAVKDPFRAHLSFTRGRAMKIVVGMWIGVIFCTGLEPFFTINFEDFKEQQYIRGNVFRVFYLNFLLFYLLPVGACVILYCLIVRRLKQRERHLRAYPARQSQGTLEDGNQPLTGCNSDDSDRRPPTRSRFQFEEHQRALKQLRAMVKMFVLLLVSFVVLMSPYRWMMFVGSVRTLRGDQPAYGWALMRQSIIQGAFSILYVTNSVINPIIFNFMAERFRLKAMRTLKSLVCKMSGRGGGGGGRNNQFHSHAVRDHRSTDTAKSGAASAGESLIVNNHAPSERVSQSSL